MCRFLPVWESRSGLIHWLAPVWWYSASSPDFQPIRTLHCFSVVSVNTTHQYSLTAIWFLWFWNKWFLFCSHLSLLCIYATVEVCLSLVCPSQFKGENAHEGLQFNLVQCYLYSDKAPPPHVHFSLVLVVNQIMGYENKRVTYLEPAWSLQHTWNRRNPLEITSFKFYRSISIGWTRFTETIATQNILSGHN